MAKLDFCFTYYDGDAASDMAHMNRLERGAYNDLILAQRKFGHLSKKIIQKVLSADFDKCWESLELILKTDAEEKFFIEWLDTSLEKSRAHSTKQKGNVERRWNNEVDTDDLPNEYQNDTKRIPLGDGYGNRDEDRNKDEKEDFEKFWNLYDKKVGDKKKLLKKWEKIPVKDRQAIMQYIPKYISAQPEKKYRKNPETFLNNKSWNDELIESNQTKTKHAAIGGDYSKDFRGN